MNSVCGPSPLHVGECPAGPVHGKRRGQVPSWHADLNPDSVDNPQAPIDTNNEAVELLEEGRSSGARILDRRQTAAELLVGGAFVVAAAAMAFLMTSGREFRPGVALVFVLAYAAATRIQFEVGAGYSPPTQLILVPMLFALPQQIVPLAVAAGLLLGDFPDFVAGRRNGVRALKVLGDSWHAIGPALVLGLAGAESPAWEDWPLYVAALAAQVGCDLVAATLREWLGRGIAPRAQIGALAWAYAVDVLLAPVGLLAAFASEDQSFAFLLLFPLAGLLVILARERQARLDNLVDLGRAERRATRAREELLASASHDMQTPLAVMLGLVDSVGSDPEMPSDQRTRIYSTMRRQTLLLRHQVRQFLDYTWVKSGRPLTVSPRSADVLPIVEEVAGAQSGFGPIEITAEGDLPRAVVDPDRLHQVLMSLVSNAVKFSPPGLPVVISVSSSDESVEIAVSDRGQGIEPDDLAKLFDEGLGLYLARALTEQQAGRIDVQSRPREGSRFTVVIPTWDGSGSRSHARSQSVQPLPLP
jgi:signal transduction histidine kinase